MDPHFSGDPSHKLQQGFSAPCWPASVLPSQGLLKGSMHETVQNDNPAVGVGISSLQENDYVCQAQNEASFLHYSHAELEPYNSSYRQRKLEWKPVQPGLGAEQYMTDDIKPCGTITGTEQGPLGTNNVHISYIHEDNYLAANVKSFNEMVPVQPLVESSPVHVPHIIDPNVSCSPESAHDRPAKGCLQDAKECSSRTVSGIQDSVYEDKQPQPNKFIPEEDYNPPRPERSEGSDVSSGISSSEFDVMKECVEFTSKPPTKNLRSKNNSKKNQKKKAPKVKTKNVPIKKNLRKRTGSSTVSDVKAPVKVAKKRGRKPQSNKKSTKESNNLHKEANKNDDLLKEKEIQRKKDLKRYKHLFKSYVKNEYGISENQFWCFVCNDLFPEAAQLRDHLAQHSKAETVTCNDCQEEFSDLDKLHQHMQKQHSGEKQLTCSQCGTQFKTMSGLKTHIRYHTGDRPYKCPHCNNAFCQSGDLTKHIRTHTGEKPYNCDICEKSFSRIPDLRAHRLLGHTDEHATECPVCKKEFQPLEKIKQHLRTHLARNTYDCKICKKVFLKKKQLQDHSVTHTGEKAFNCNLCDKTFHWAKSLKIHMRNHTGERPYQCSECEKRFVRLEDMKGHQRTHQQIRPFMCSTCGKCFPTSSTLKTHTYVHSTEKPFKCHLCDYGANRPYYLKHHMQRHTGEGDFKCQVCGMFLICKKALDHHMMIHNNEKPYQCEHCTYATNRPYNLKIHARKAHPQCLTEKDLQKKSRTSVVKMPTYRCAECPYTCSRMDYLNRHMKRHLDQNGAVLQQFNCKLCGFTSHRQSNVNAHMRRIHNVGDARPRKTSSAKLKQPSPPKPAPMPPPVPPETTMTHMQLQPKLTTLHPMNEQHMAQNHYYMHTDFPPQVAMTNTGLLPNNLPMNAPPMFPQSMSVMPSIVHGECSRLVNI